MKLAFAFPGVGAALTGREAAFVQRNMEQAAPLLERASDLSGVDLGAALEAGDLSGLDEETAQLFTYAFSCAMARALSSRGQRPAAAAGYSMGLYAALECAGVLSFDDGLAVTREAYRAMGRVCGGGGPHGLAVTVGLTREDLEGILERDLARVRLVNVNNATALVCAGPIAELERLVEQALEADAIKAALLPASLPYHHAELLARAPGEFARFLATLSWREPSCPVVSAVSGQALSSAAALRDLTAAHLARPIALPPMLGALAGLGVEAAVECGPGISLTQSARMVSGAPRLINVKNVERRLGV